MGTNCAPLVADLRLFYNWYIAPQMEHSFSFLKFYIKVFFTLKICMRIDIAKPLLDLNFRGE